MADLGEQLPAFSQGHTRTENQRRPWQGTQKGIEKELLDDYVKYSEELTISELKELYIGTYILGNSFEEVVDQIINPFEKKEYSSKKLINKSITID